MNIHLRVWKASEKMKPTKQDKAERQPSKAMHSTTALMNEIMGD